jgi:hypothetical protein
MKKISLEKASLETCVSEARQQRVVITRKCRPAALLVSVEGMDMEQLQLGSSDRFWNLRWDDSCDASYLAVSFFPCRVGAVLPSAARNLLCVLTVQNS